MRVSKRSITFLILLLAVALPIQSILAAVTPEEVAEEVTNLIKTEHLSQKYEKLPNEIGDSKAIKCNCCGGRARNGDCRKWCCSGTCCGKNEADPNLMNTDSKTETNEKPDQVGDSKAIKCNCCGGRARNGDCRKWCCSGTCCGKNEVDANLKNTDKIVPKPRN